MRIRTSLGTRVIRVTGDAGAQHAFRHTCTKHHPDYVPRLCLILLRLTCGGCFCAPICGSYPQVPRVSPGLSNAWLAAAGRLRLLSEQLPMHQMRGSEPEHPTCAFKDQNMQLHLCISCISEMFQEQAVLLALLFELLSALSLSNAHQHCNAFASKLALTVIVHMP